MFRSRLDARSKFLQGYCVCGWLCMNVYWYGLSLWIWVLPVCFTGKQITALLWYLWMSLCFGLGKTFKTMNYCCELNCCQSWLDSKRKEAWRQYELKLSDQLWIHVTLSCVHQKQKKKKERKIKSSAPCLSPLQYTFEPTDFWVRNAACHCFQMGSNTTNEIVSLWSCPLSVLLCFLPSGK